MRARRTLRRAAARARYRVSQVARGFRTYLTPAEIRALRALLGPAELALFAAMHPRDRRHSIDVLRWLEVTSGTEAPSAELKRAALLHDVGKGQLALTDRVAFVLLEALSPRAVSLLGSRDGARWRRALWTLRHHAALGGERLAAAGSDARVVALVRRHTAPPSASDAELARLIEADRAN